MAGNRRHRLRAPHRRSVGPALAHLCHVHQGRARDRGRLAGDRPRGREHRNQLALDQCDCPDRVASPLGRRARRCIPGLLLWADRRLDAFYSQFWHGVRRKLREAL